MRYLQTEAIVSEYVQQLFAPYPVLETVVFAVTRNADVNPDDEVFADEADFRKRKKVLGERRRLSPVRLELSTPISERFTKYFWKNSNSPLNNFISPARR